MANPTYKININLNDGTATYKSPVNKNKSIVENTTETAINTGLIVSTAKNLLNIGTSSVEMLTGSTTAQNSVNSLMSAGAYAVGLFKNPIGTGIALALKTINFQINRSNEIIWQNRQAEQLRRLSGNYLSTSER